MNDLLKHKLFDESDCISEQTMFDYIDKKLSAKECHLVEKHLLHCDLCADALEGLELVKDRQRIKVINEKINERVGVSEKETKVVYFNYKVVFSIAASLLLLIGGMVFFKLMNEKKEMALLKTESAHEELIPPPPPPANMGSAPEEGAAASAPKQEATPENKSNLDQQQKNAELEKKADEVVSVLTQASRDAAKAKAEKQAQDEYGVSMVGLAKPGKDAAPEPSKALDNEQLYREQDVVTTETSKSKKKESNTPIREMDADKKDELYKMSETPVSAGAGAASSVSRAGNVDSEVSAKSAKKTSKSGLFGGLSEASEKRREAKAQPQQNMDAAFSNSAPQTVADDVAPVQEAKVTAMVLAQNPEYVGGQEAFISFIRKKFNQTVMSNNSPAITTALNVQFTIDAKGALKNPKIIKGINAEVDAELLRVMRLSSKWKPANLNGKAVEQVVNMSVSLK